MHISLGIYFPIIYLFFTTEKFSAMAIETPSSPP